MQTISDTLHFFFCRSARQDAGRKGQMSPSYQPSHRTQATIWSDRGLWQAELTEAGGRKGHGEASTLHVALEHAEARLYGF